MSFISLAKSLAAPAGEIPGVSLQLAKNKIQEALGKVYDETDWSFQTIQGAWLTTGMVANIGTFTTTVGSEYVVADATASSILNGVQNGVLTKCQFRNPAYSLYNIIAIDNGANDDSPNPGFFTLTLDRVWMEPAQGAGQPYMIYQALFPAPVDDFRKFVEIRDTLNGQAVNFWDLNQDDLAHSDVRRLMFGPRVPTYAVPWGVDNRPNTATPGRMLFELWPHVLAIVPFTFSCKRRGPMLTNPNDTLPYPLTESLVSFRAKELLSLWKEAQKGDAVERGAGADWRFLAQANKAEYQEEYKRVRKADANLHHDFVTRTRGNGTGSGEAYSTLRTGQLNVGRP